MIDPVRDGLTNRHVGSRQRRELSPKLIEQLGSSLDCAIATLVALGHEPDHAKDAARRFKELEMDSIVEVAPHRHDEAKIIGMAQQNLQDLDSLLLNAPLPLGGKRD